MIDKTRRTTLVVLACAMLAASGAFAQEIVKIGLIVPLTGPFTPTGRQIEAGARLYI